MGDRHEAIGKQTRNNHSDYNQKIMPIAYKPLLIA